ncbi:MAG: beta-N-acetylhexosaminidase [Clostridiales bacterium]|jgi:hypothetical protein|nr:beta-N-acetylhexosaminidase [Clostridiales bacterium]
MNVNISKLPEELRAGVTEVQRQLGIVFDAAAGIELTAEQGEAFRVSLDGKKAAITYAGLNQFYRGLMLLKAACNKKAVTFDAAETCVFSEFGVMLDCSRNAVRNVETLKSFIRHLALMGYNQLQLYTEDTYEVEGEPYFGYLRGRYSTKELQELDAYGARFGVELVPCIQTLAHLDAIFRWPKYAEINDIDDILVIGDERTYTLIDNMLLSVKKQFKTDKIHIGMDEAHRVGRGKYYDKNGDSDKTKLLLQHLARVVALCKKHGLKPMMWSDMFFRLAFDNQYYLTDPSMSVDPSVKELIPEGLELVYWDYYHTDKAEYDLMADKHFELADSFVFGGGAWMWSGFAPANRYAIETVKAGIASMQHKGVKKAFWTMWGDNGAECSPFAVLPTLLTAAQLAYGGEETGDAMLALTGLEFDKFMALELPDMQDEYLPPNANNPSKYMLYADCFSGIFDTLVREGDGKVYQKHIKTLKAAAKSAGDYAYLFETMGALCEVLEIKYELGVKTRNAYNTGDPRAVKSLAKGEYHPLIKRIEAFYDCFEAQWMRENKPNGFEVQDIRLGGLVKRLAHCAARLEAYAAGKLSAIPELTEKLLPYAGEGGTLKGTVNYNNYGQNVSAGKL